MNNRINACLVLAPVALAALGAVAFHQEPGQEMGVKPTEHHKLMAQDAGTWDAEVRWWMAPGTEANEMRGTETNAMCCTGLWMESTFKENNGMFEGRGLSGYDLEKGKYVGVWVDNMTSAMMHMEGSYDPATKTLTMTGEAKDPTGVKVKNRMVTEYKSPTVRVMTNYATMEGASEWKSMEIKYTKQK